MTNKVDAMKEPVDSEDAAARLAQALSHPVRLRILTLLRDEGAYVMHLTSTLGRPQANISQHLAILREAGLVTDEREGMSVVYRVRDARIFELIDRLAAMAARVPSAAFEHEGPRSAVTGPAVRRRGHGMGGMRQHGHCHCPRCSGR